MVVRGGDGLDARGHGLFAIPSVDPGPRTQGTRDLRDNLPGGPDQGSPRGTAHRIEPMAYALRESIWGRTRVSGRAPTSLPGAGGCVGLRVRAAGLLPHA